MDVKTIYHKDMMHVVKATGEAEPYDEEKLIASIRRAGIPRPLENQVLNHIKEKVYDDIPTSVIYHHIKEYLKRSENPSAFSKYSLKQSIMDLGPTGYPFEDYFAHLMQSEGFETTVRNIIRGKCITHEIDVIATKNSEKAMVEAKFHNFPGTKTSVHVAMYTKARFDDVKVRNNFTFAWLVTNTKITSDAIAFAACYQMRITSWEYPEKNSLRDMVEKNRLFPITSLLSLSHTQKAQLLELGVVLVKDLSKNPTCLEQIHVPDHRREEIKSEAESLLSS